MSDTVSTSARQRGATRPPATAATVGLTPATIERRAYEKFVARGYVHGYDVDDWFQAERELLAEVAPVARGDAKPVRKTAAKASAKKAAAKPSAKEGGKTSATPSATPSTKTSTKKTTANKTTAKKATAKKSTATKATGRSATKKG